MTEKELRACVKRAKGITITYDGRAAKVTAEDVLDLARECRRLMRELGKPGKVRYARKLLKCAGTK